MNHQTRNSESPRASIRTGSLLLSIALLCWCNFVAAQTTSTTAPANSASSTSAQLIGSWHLVSRQSRSATGEIVPDRGLAETPWGILIYDQSGHVAAQLSRRDRTVAMLPGECQAAITTKGTADTAQTILGYDAYFGTYTIDERAGVVTHHLQAALF